MKHTVNKYDLINLSSGNITMKLCSSLLKNIAPFYVQGAKDYVELLKKVGAL